MAETRQIPGPVPAPAGSRVESRGTEIDLRYVRYEALGAGLIGTVYRGKHTGLGYEVAIKELKDVFVHFPFLQRPEVLKRLKRELTAQAQLRHPCIAAVLDQNLEVARPYFVTELCAGGSLRKRLEASPGGLPVELALRWFLQAASALEAAHAAGLVHQGIRPENLLLDDRGNAKVSDFGLARILELDSATAPPFFIGASSPTYLAPELLARGATAGPESDVYALGILFYETLTGMLPGRRSPLPSAARTDVPREFDAIFERMTADRRDQRHPDAGAVLDELFGVLRPTLGTRHELVLSIRAGAMPGAGDRRAAAPRPANVALAAGRLAEPAL